MSSTPTRCAAHIRTTSTDGTARGRVPAELCARLPWRVDRLHELVRYLQRSGTLASRTKRQGQFRLVSTPLGKAGVMGLWKYLNSRITRCG